MPRGDNPNSRANLRPLEKGLPKKDQRDIQLKGAKAGAKANKEYATLTEALKDQCTPEVKAQLTDMLIKRAKQGNLKAYELLRDQLGEKPIDKVAVASINEDAVSDLKNAIARRKDGAHEG